MAATEPATLLPIGHGIWQFRPPRRWLAYAGCLMLLGCGVSDPAPTSSAAAATAHDGSSGTPRSGTGRRLTLTAGPGQVIADGLVHAPLDPETGRRGSPALTCMLSDCPGRGHHDDPYLFVYQSLDPAPEGGANIIWPQATKPGEQVLCPACGRAAGVTPYVPEMVRQRILELQDELARSRAARAAARSARRPMPNDHRTPKDILEEQSSLPQVYLVDE